ncbi:leucine-rich repeat-containing protein 4C-like [Daktulosphaira vitifoliae]|uniref:leucine-rich repeat-containing protein 4C-like n=1 Tax=Daktulosphaira vitifoliae TaxID=58002 RepID=UPI0021A9AE8D|nr:leucine-rich repeat-containing protein 4C-like [Daktulosphaira vitifoliae]
MLLPPCKMRIVTVMALWCAVLSALVSVTAAFDGCPSVCSCKWKGGRRTAECADRALITVPTGVDPDTLVLDLSGNNLQILPNETFARAGLQNLQRVYLRNCRIGQIDESAFFGLTNLIELDLSNNLLTQVPSFVFRDIPHLRNLSVAWNPIQKIENHAFSDVIEIIKVDASHCGLQSISSRAFDGIARLETLKINDNKLSELPAAVLETLNKLRSIELHDNPWVCDCYLRPMKLWLSTNTVPYGQPPVCIGGPERLSGKPMMDLDVEDFDCRPDVRVESRYVDVAEGANVSVRCRVEPGSMAHIAWYFNGRRLQAAGVPIGYPSIPVNPRMIFVDTTDEIGGRRSEMTLVDVHKDDAGQYSCLAENRAGNSEANFTVYVTERPSVIMSTFGTGPINGIAAALAALILFILVLIALTVIRIRRSGYPSDTKPTATVNNHQHKPSSMISGGKSNPALDISSVIEHNYDPDLETRPSVITPNGTYHVTGLDLIHDHDASRLEMCDSPLSAKPPSYYSGSNRTMTTGTLRPYDDRTPIIGGGGGGCGDAYSVGTGSDEVFSYNSGQQPYPLMQSPVMSNVNSEYPADYGLPIIPPLPQHHQMHPEDVHNYHQSHQPQQQQPPVKTLRVWQRGVPVLPTTPSLQRFTNRTSPTTPGTDV